MITIKNFLEASIPVQQQVITFEGQEVQLSNHFGDTRSIIQYGLIDGSTIYLKSQTNLPQNSNPANTNQLTKSYTHSSAYNIPENPSPEQLLALCRVLEFIYINIKFLE